MYTSLLLLPGSYDDDPGSKRDAEQARYEKDSETKGQNTMQILNRSKTLKEHGTKDPESKRVAECKRYLVHAEARRAVKRAKYSAWSRETKAEPIAASRLSNLQFYGRSIYGRTFEIGRSVYRQEIDFQ